MFAQDEVGGEVVRRPRLEQRWSLRAELENQVAELFALNGVEEGCGHRARSVARPNLTISSIT